ncbi:MAG: potassium-transporting ATPase subunit KdpC [Myxococcota bacterium]
MLRPALTLLALFTALTGLLYPALVTALAHGLFPDQAAGSLVRRDGQVLGSRLIGQTFSQPGQFWSRPSATVPPHDASASSGSNLGPNNPRLLDAVAARLAALRDAGVEAPVPVDLVTTSASGLDPDLSPDAARAQIARVAQARNLPRAEVAALVERLIEPRTLALWGEPRVNVLELNLALEALATERGK